MVLLAEREKADRSGKMSAYTIGSIIDLYLNNDVTRFEGSAN